jgi:hypothetical protein
MKKTFYGVWIYTQHPHFSHLSFTHTLPGRSNLQKTHWVKKEAKGRKKKKTPPLETHKTRRRGRQPHATVQTVKWFCFLKLILLLKKKKMRVARAPGRGKAGKKG